MVDTGTISVRYTARVRTDLIHRGTGVFVLYVGRRTQGSSLQRSQIMHPLNTFDEYTFSTRPSNYHPNSINPLNTPFSILYTVLN